jgi:DNA replication protein DnaC
MREKIQKHLETLKIPMTTEQVDEILRDATQSKPAYLELLERFLSRPAGLRRERSVELRLRRANFRDPGTLESFDWEFNAKTIDPAPFRELATGDFVRRKENVVFVGNSGLGKSHLIQAIGRCCCLVGHRVRYVTSAALLEELTAAAGDRTLSERVRFYGRFDLLIIDEFGFDKLERLEYPESPSLLYKIIDHRNGRASTAMVTNIDFTDWTDYLGDPQLAMALLDRVVDRANKQRFEGKSYRAFRSEQKTNQNPQSKTVPGTSRKKASARKKS